MTLTPLNLTDTLTDDSIVASVSAQCALVSFGVDAMALGKLFRTVDVFIPITRQAKDQTQTYETL